MPKCLYLFILTIAIATQAKAEMVELSLSGNYRRSFLPDSSNSNEIAKDEARALSFGISYYLKEMTALEFSYTTGSSERTIPSSTITSITTHSYSMLGADLVLTFAKKTERFIPYIKGGIGYFIDKRIEYNYINHTTPSASDSDQVVIDPTLVPSVGLGMKTKVTQNFFVRTGLEVWTSGPANRNLDELDWSFRLGLSWYL